MAKSIINKLMLICIILALLSFDLPMGWYQTGSKPLSYEMGVAVGAGQDGKNAATIRSINKKIRGFGTLMQNSKPDKYLGKRIKMTGYVKTENVKSTAGLWLRIDQYNSKKPLAFDNMFKRPIKGTTAWTKYEIVLDVPNIASNLAYGALLNGTGQLWFDNIKFEVVDETVPITGQVNTGRDPFTEDEPTNLDFEK
jgi:hypothetical protein